MDPSRTYIYRIKDEAKGIVFADNPEQAIDKVRNAYTIHYGEFIPECNDIKVEPVNNGAWLPDSPDVIEVCDD